MLTYLSILLAFNCFCLNIYIKLKLMMIMMIITDSVASGVGRFLAPVTEIMNFKKLHLMNFLVLRADCFVLF